MHVLFAISALMLPFGVYAQTIQAILFRIDTIIDAAVAVVVSLAVLVFVWGLTQYLLKVGDSEGQKAAKNIMIWGVLGLFVAVSIWGLVEVLQNTFNVDSDTPLPPPQI